ncbi:MAG: hypothetical protein H7A23_07045 [Leptospiraceae bacterium]|nr:hypothetical protein [Leptospiraceae bacterium]MCP5494295.1 hypothetical protein [Leptospiraceae bacterium]
MLDLTIKELGFPTIEDFARYYTFEILEHKLVSYKHKIREFEQKHSLVDQYGILEKEDDHFEWESLEHSLPAHKSGIAYNYDNKNK